MTLELAFIIGLAVFVIGLAIRVARLEAWMRNGFVKEMKSPHTSPDTTSI